MKAADVFKPYLMRIEQVTEETPDVKTLRLAFLDERAGKDFSFRTGQFGEYSVFGEGECTFCIASPPTRQGYIECTFRKAGRVTSALAGLEPGETIGFRGPYGNIFPIRDWEGKNLLFIAGGIALPPMRSVIWNILDLRDRYGDITIVYGARTVADLVYKRELAEWAGRSRCQTGHHRRSRRRDAGLERRDRLRADRARQGRSFQPQYRGRGLRPAGDDQVHLPGAGQTGLCSGKYLYHPGEPHEVRRGQVRPLQCRQVLCLQRWTGVHLCPAAGDAAGVLIRDA